MLLMAIWIITTVITYIIAVRAGLARPHILAFGNLIFPFAGLFYALYLIHIYLPRREGHIPPVLIFIRVFTEEILKEYKNWRNKNKS